MSRTLALAAALSTALGCSLLTAGDLDTVRKTRDAGGTPNLVGDRTSLDFGSVPVGASSPPAALKLSNTGTAPLGTFSASVGGGGAAAFTVADAGACTGLEPGKSCELPLVFTPSAAQAFSATATLEAAPGGSLSVSLSGTGVVAGALAVAPGVIDFGAVTQGSSSAGVTFTVRNTGNVASGALTSQLTGADAVQFEITQDDCAAALDPGAACTLSARFAPGLPGPRRATLTVTGAPGGTAVATLSGNGLAPGSLAISPSGRTFASLPAGSQGATTTFQVTNTGAAATGPLAVSLAGGGSGDFELVGGTCSGRPLEPMTQCALQLRFAPTSAGVKVASLVVSGAPGGAVSAALTGTALASAALRASPTRVGFGTVVTTAPQIAVVTVDNPGAVATGPLTATVTGDDAGVFSVVGGCAQSLDAGQACPLQVRFAPVEDGAREGTLVVSATPGGAVSVPLSGVGATPGALRITPAMHAFGSVAEGSLGTPRGFTVTNNGGTTTAALAVALGGTNADQFSVVQDGCQGGTLAPQGSCDVRINFAPTGGGSKSGTLTVSAVDAGAAVALLNGAGLAQASLGVSPLMADFGAEVAGLDGVTRTFSVVNNGDVPTAAALLAGLDGGQAAAFTISSNTCAAATLSGGASCSVAVRFTPPVGASGAQATTLEVRPASGPGGTARATLTATALTPPSLSFDLQSFGGAVVGTPVDRTFTLTNSGGGTSAAITLGLAGGAVADFQLLAPTGQACRSGVTTLAGGASCTAQVRFTPTAPGTRSSTLTATPAGGTASTAALQGTGLRPATLQGSVPTYTFAPIELGQQTAAYDWTVRNVGDVPSGAVSVRLDGGNAADFSQSNTCSGTLAPDAGCTVTLRLTPGAGGQRQATVTASATPGGAASVAITGTGQARLTVTKSGGGTGTVTSVPAGISCGATCTALYDLQTVILQARTTNGSNSVFAGWTGACASAGATRDCAVTTDLSKSVGAIFLPVNNNLVFVSDGPLPTNLGSAAAYDARCNAMATDAGINNATQDAYVAWISSPTSAAVARLGSARGFVRVDGRAVADQLASDLLANSRILNPIALDQFGVKRVVHVMTGTDSAGNQVATYDCCNAWTTNASNVGYLFGRSSTGPVFWSAENFLGCDQPGAVYCFMKTKTVALAPPVATGKRLWVTNTPWPVGGGQTPDQKCQAERPSGVTTGRAFLGTATQALAGLLNPAQTYVRPDGQIVGTYDELVAGQGVRTGVWQQADGTYGPFGYWTGYGDPRPLLDPPPQVGTCAGWTSGSASLIGRAGGATTTSGWVAGVDNNGCNDTLRLICFEP